MPDSPIQGEFPKCRTPQRMQPHGKSDHVYNDTFPKLGKFTRNGIFSSQQNSMGCLVLLLLGRWGL